ncbi:MAG: benzoate-CoA ligase family protein [Acidobacteria bacterium]|nr:benzoate-CoA ligase family protein [Acidobacteriota bacterium]
MPLIADQFNAATFFIDRHIAEGRQHKAAIECFAPSGPPEPVVTYGQLAQNVNRAGNALRALGVRREERVAMLLLDSPEFLYVFFGAIKIGAVPVPLNTLLKAHDYEYLLNDCRARVVVASEALLPSLPPSGSLRYVEHIVVAGDAQPASWRQSRSLRQLLGEHSPFLEPELTSRDDAAFWLYSSGSTGRPKACIHLQHDMVVAAEHYAVRVLGIRADDRCFSVAKLFFAYGLGNAGYFPLAVGATSILWSGSTHPANVFACIERHRPTLFYSVPSNFAALLLHAEEQEQAAGRRFDLSTIRWAVSAGEALPAAIYHRFRERFGVEILDAIGSTEALHMFIANRPGAVRPGSSGQIIPGYEARIVDDAGCEVAPGEIGNLLIKSDSVCAGYWDQPERTNATFQGEWLRTGDKYRQDEDGYYWYAGRSDDMLKVSGVWVSPVEIEAVLIEHPAVAEAAVIGKDDGEGLLKPAACIVLRSGCAATDALKSEILDLVTSRLAHYKRPRWIEYVNELPKTATGKIQRFKLRELYGAHTGSQ